MKIETCRYRFQDVVTENTEKSRDTEQSGKSATLPGWPRFHSEYPFAFIARSFHIFVMAPCRGFSPCSP